MKKKWEVQWSFTVAGVDFVEAKSKEEAEQRIVDLIGDGRMSGNLGNISVDASPVEED